MPAVSRSYVDSIGAIAKQMSPPRFVLQTFGCQMNVHDSQRMEDALVSHGWERCEEWADADLIVFNTCSVREKAEQKLRSEVGRLKPLKLARPDVVIAVAGCLAQQEGEKILARIPHVDVVIGPDNLGELPMLAELIRHGGPPVARTVFDLEAPTFLTARPELHPERKTPLSAYVTTMKGCDERCSFCIVPTTRGPERYRALSEIVQEIDHLVKAGAKEITLLGQTVNSWSDAPRDRHDPSDFSRLLRTIAREVPALQRLRYTSPHPRHVTDELIQAHRDLDVLAHHVHLPVQSGSDRMLRRMIRRYTYDDYMVRADRLKSARPDMTLSTDIIVGFPGETDADFEDTLRLVRAAGFVALFAFKFSPRPDTPALKLGDDVPEEVKAARLAALFAAAEVQQNAHLASLVGSRASVLIEGDSRPSSARNRDPLGLPTHGTRVMGRTQRNEIVHIDVPTGRNAAGLIGRFMDISIIEANAHSLVGALQPHDVLTLETLAVPLAALVTETLVTKGTRRLDVVSG